MPVEMTMKYRGDLLCSATHEPSGATIKTEAPKDNGGRGLQFSPTDLVGTALGTCMLTIMGLIAQRHGWDMTGAKVKVLKEMASVPVRRIGKLTVTVTLPQALINLTDEDRTILEEGALACPVKASLHPDVEVAIKFDYQKV